MRVLALWLLLSVFASALSADESALPTRPTSEIAALIESAEPGATVQVPRARYLGPLVIKKPVILDGSLGAVIDGEGATVVVEILAAHVTFRHFTVRGSSGKVEGEPAGIRAETGPVFIEGNTLEDVLFGIDLREAPDSVVRGNIIFGKALEPGRRGDGIRLWWSHGAFIEGNRLRGMRDAVFWYSEGLSIRNNHVTDGRYGLHFMYSHRTVVESNILEDNSVGIYLMYSNGFTLRDNRISRNRGTSGYGIGLKDCDDVLCTSNRILANRVGVYADRCPFSNDGTGIFEGNHFAFNETGISLTPQTTRNQIFGNAFIENEEQISVHGRGDLFANEFTKDGRGNFWSDYAGYDRDQDGIGDLEHRGVSLFDNLLARQPNLRLFSHSLAQDAVEFTARAVPEIQPAPKFIDPFPLMSPPALEEVDASDGPRGTMLGVCLALLGLGGAAVTWGTRNPIRIPARRLAHEEELS